jgi:hypothetical protein
MSGAAAKKEQDTEVGGIAGDRLRSIVERIERLEEERKGLGENIKDIFAEAKSAGFDVKGGCGRSSQSGRRSPPRWRSRKRCSICTGARSACSRLSCLFAGTSFSCDVVIKAGKNRVWHELPHRVPVDSARPLIKGAAWLSARDFRSWRHKQSGAPAPSGRRRRGAPPGAGRGCTPSERGGARRTAGDATASEAGSAARAGCARAARRGAGLMRRAGEAAERGGERWARRPRAGLQPRAQQQPLRAGRAQEMEKTWAQPRRHGRGGRRRQCVP